MDIATLQWFGIVFCVSQSAMFSGLNLAFFSLSRLQLEVEVSQGNKAAVKILKMRQDSNFLLTTILWGNVGINVLLTLLSNSLLTGISAFVFSTVVITFLGEIIPQAYFSRNALCMAAMLAPVLRFYQILFYPVAKTSSIMLDLWLGKEGIDYLREKDLRSFITKHIEAEEADVDHIEGVGALNFLAIDDISVTNEGEKINPKSIIKLPVSLDLPIIPVIERTANDPFLQQVHASGHNWVVLTDMNDEPRLIIDADGFLRAAIFDLDHPFDPYHYCHRPLIVRDMNTPMGDIIPHIRGVATKDKNHDGEIEHDVVLIWGKEKRIITGADILGRLFKGIGHKASEVIFIDSNVSNEINQQDS
ncbi:Mg2+ and Co2+ transporter CorB [Methyloprofundus sedimenti]|uniref:Mg2+ and Co2+ transporter CorB n=1 Tax=Methyloprofundus sedimenti TaxID=1420851 RepID=A0A1V8MB15_9GAMM|nr:Mg2+ and Co2+ transporter CorB [Methyloprofundus sedimenti]